MEQGAPIPLLVIGGPTATGKTALAIDVAQAVGGEIVSADSMAVYIGMDIGTAKPSPEERSKARFHLIDYVPPNQPYSLARFLADAEAAIKQIWSRGRLPILCGGTGLYVRALLRGYLLPEANQAEVLAARQRYERLLAERGLEALIEELRRFDPEACSSIDLKNPRRVIRALEIVATTGLPLSQARAALGRPRLNLAWRGFVLCCPRRILYRRVDERVDKMMQAGWLDEVRRLADAIPPGSTAAQAIGYRHLLEFLFPEKFSVPSLPGRPADGTRRSRAQPDLEAVVQRIKRDTRRFAKRQITWWKREEGFAWRCWETPMDFAAIALEATRAAQQLLTLAGRRG